MCASARDIVAYGNSDIASKMQIKREILKWTTEN